MFAVSLFVCLFNNDMFTVAHYNADPLLWLSVYQY